MTSRTKRVSPRTGRRSLLAIPAIAVPTALIAAAVLIPNAASGAVDLPDLTPQELIEFASTSDVDQLSGTIEQTADLGLPDFSSLSTSFGAEPATADDSAADIEDLLSLATGSYTAKVYLDGDSARLQVLDSLAERNVYLDGESQTGWFVDSESQTATKLTLAERAEPGLDDTYELETPQTTLEEALANLDESTVVTVGSDASVAGRDAYELILEPRSDDTLVGSINFAIDGETGLALAASVTAAGSSEPAFSLAFTDVSLDAPEASTLIFEPSSSMTISEEEIALPSGHERDGEEASALQMSVTGEGWSRVVEMSAASDGDSYALDKLTAEQQTMLESFTTGVDGGRIFETALLTVLLADDGRIFAGAVPADVLVDAASGQ
ncbi:LolA family protein (plasmid) [Coraliomargarita sp. W4R53]